MTTIPCHEFEARWNALLDQRGGGGEFPELEADLARHAASCSECRLKEIGYQKLRLALQALGPLTGPPPESTERILAAHGARLRLGPGRPTRWSLAAAAALLLVCGFWASGIGHRRSADPAAPNLAARPPARPLAESLADATAATLDLARVTSEPATRLGLQVLQSADFPEPSWRLLSVRTPSAAVTPPPDDPDDDAPQTEIAPLTGSTRNAFQFLLGPTRF